MQPHHISLLSVFILSLTLLSCSPQVDTLRIYEQEKVMMGTVMKIKAVAEGDEVEKTQEAFDAAFRQIAGLESELSEGLGIRGRCSVTTITQDRLIDQKKH